MKRIIILLAVITTLLITGCSSAESLKGADQKAASLIDCLDFEEYLKYATDFIEGEFISYEQKDQLGYCTFDVIKDYRENGLNGEVIVTYMPADHISEGIIYDVPFVLGEKYLIPLSRSSSVFAEDDILSFASELLVIPANDYKKSAALYGTPLREHIKTQEALDAFDNGRLAEYILEAVKDNPRISDGIPYIVSSDPEEIVAFSDHVIKVTVGKKIIEGFTGQNATYRCTVEEVMKGELQLNARVMIIFAKDQVTEGSSYIVAVREVDSPALLQLSSKNGVFDCSEYDAIKELIDNE